MRMYAPSGLAANGRGHDVVACIKAVVEGLPGKQARRAAVAVVVPL